MTKVHLQAKCAAALNKSTCSYCKLPIEEVEYATVNFEKVHHKCYPAAFAKSQEEKRRAGGQHDSH